MTLMSSCYYQVLYINKTNNFVKKPNFQYQYLRYVTLSVILVVTNTIGLSKAYNVIILIYRITSFTISSKDVAHKDEFKQYSCVSICYLKVLFKLSVCDLLSIIED